MRFFVFSIVGLLVSLLIHAQQPVRRLPGIINHPSLNLFAPFMSADGNAIVFISDNGTDGQYVVSYTSRETDWKPPVELPKHLSNRLMFTRGYALSADGKTMYLTSAKSPVIGGYDIFVSELKGNTWSNPENLMLPINSRTNEGCPSVTPDGTTIYFMRCDRMNTEKAEGCKLFRSSKKPNGQWGEPEELPAHINTGNSQTPRILADKETLIFSSDKFAGSKGGMDLYITRFQDGKWSEPQPLDFVNTERDDQYVSVNALGRYILKEERGARNNWQLTEFLIPVEFKPKALTKVTGTVRSRDGSPVSAYISAVDIFTGKRVRSLRPDADGTYFFYLPEGTTYEIAFDPEKGEHLFHTMFLDVTGEKIKQIEKVDVVMGAPESGDEIKLDILAFQPFTAEIDPGTTQELKRLARLAKSNPQFGFEIQVLLDGYRESFEQGDPDLTEIIELSDTLHIVDSTGAVVGDSVIHRTIYHNDRTIAKARAITTFLTGEGVNGEQLTMIVNAIKNDEVTPVTTIKARIYNR